MPNPFGFRRSSSTTIGIHIGSRSPNSGADEMTVALVASVAFLVAASALLVLHRSGLGRAVRHKYGLPPGVVAAFFALLGVTGIVNIADLQWFPGRTDLSLVATVLLIVSVVIFGV